MPEIVFTTEAPSGTIIDLFPQNGDLADWLTRKIRLTEGTGARSSQWIGEGPTGAYCVFFGGTAPVDFSESEGVAFSSDLDDSIAVLLSRTATSVTVTHVSPVATNGNLSEIVIGDDYLAANGRSLDWTIAEIPGVVVATANCYFGLKLSKNSSTYSALVAGTVTDNGDDTWTLSFDIAKEDTENLPRGYYEWSVEVQSAAGAEMTQVKSGKQVRLVEKQT